jgi:hypothetical protein
MKSLLEIPVYLIIYADNNCMPLIKEIRDSFGLNMMTYYVQMEFHELPKYKYLDIVKQNREKYWPTKDERTCSENHILQISKVDFITKTMDLNPFHTTKFGWIDASLGSVNLSKICENYENHMLLNVLHNITDKFHVQILNVCDKKYKDVSHKHEMYRQYRWIVCGSFYTMGEIIGRKIISRINEIAIDTMMNGYGHGDELIFLEILDEFYDDIYRSYGDYYNILNNFIRPTKGFEYINICIIKNYLDKQYYKECYDCCKVILNEYETYNVKINYETYFSILFSYYISSYYHKGAYEAKQLIDYIIELISMNPYIKNEFDKNKEFYEMNFNLALSDGR